MWQEKLNQAEPHSALGHRPPAAKPIISRDSAFAGGTINGGRSA